MSTLLQTALGGTGEILVTCPVFRALGSSPQARGGFCGTQAEATPIGSAEYECVLTESEGFRDKSCHSRFLWPVRHSPGPLAACLSHVLSAGAGAGRVCVRQLPWWSLRPRSALCSPCRTRTARPSVQIPEEGQSDVLWPEDHEKGNLASGPVGWGPGSPWRVLLHPAALGRPPPGARPAGQGWLGGSGRFAQGLAGLKQVQSEALSAL